MVTIYERGILFWGEATTSSVTSKIHNEAQRKGNTGRKRIQLGGITNNFDLDPYIHRYLRLSSL